jgi:hypothetical protein
MRDSAHAAHFLAAAGAAGAAMDEDREWRAVARRFLCRRAIHDHHPAVIGAGPENERLRRHRIVGEEREDERAEPAVGEGNRVGDVLIGHERRDRPKRLDIVDGRRAPWIVGSEQDRRHEGAIALDR